MRSERERESVIGGGAEEGKFEDVQLSNSQS